MPAPMPFRDKVKELAVARGLSVSKLGYLAFDLETRGTSPDTLNKAIQGRGKLNDHLTENVAKVLEVPPEVFVEYRLSQLRRSLDENVVGFDEAAARLELIEDALQQAMGQRLAEHAEQAAAQTEAAEQE